MENILNYIKVSDSIATAGLPTKKQIKKVAKVGFDVVINLSISDKRSLKKEDEIVSKNGMVYIHIPISWTKPELDRLKMFLDVLEFLESQNKKVFIHCMKNYRVSVFIYKYKKDILKQKNVKFIAPKEYKPNKAWRKVLKAKV